MVKILKGVPKFQGNVLLLCVSLILLSPSHLFAQEGLFYLNSDTVRSDFKLSGEDPFFENQSIIDVEIVTNLGKLKRSIPNPNYQKGYFKMKLNDSINMVKEIRLRVRGHTRRELCPISPLKLDFNETPFLSEWFDNIKSLKLVNPCSDGGDYQAYLLKEYLIYKLYQKVTGFSFKVSLLSITISDSKRVQPEIRGYAFLLENDQLFADRNQMTELESEDLTTAQLINKFYYSPDPNTLYNINLMSMFQYMVGNSDWNLAGLHNVKVFDKDGVYYPVPYDFDFAGMVNTKYAKPSPSIPIKKVTERFYQGPCSDPVEVQKALYIVKQQKSNIYQVINEFPLLRNSQKKTIIQYLDDFYESAEEEKIFVNELATSNCQN